MTVPPLPPAVWLRRGGLVLLLLSLVGTTTLLTGAGAANAQAEDALVLRGQELYGQACALCHGAEGVGLDAPGRAGGPSLIGVGAASVDFMLRTGRMPLNDQRDRLRHREPTIGDADREALIAYITALAPGEGPAIPSIDGWEDASLARGLEQFTSNCAACHGPTAAGIAVGQRDVSSSLDVASPLEIAEAVRTGPGVMPVFGEDVMDQEDLEAVVAWVMDLRERAAPGGLSVGRSGPVTEGTIAWVLGFGLLGLIMYLLGEKAGDDEESDDVA